MVQTATALLFLILRLARPPMGLDREKLPSALAPLRARALAARTRWPAFASWADSELARAIDASNEDRAMTLLALGADPDGESLPGLTLGARCARFGHERLLRWAAASGADLGARGEHGWTAAHHAASKNQAACLREIVLWGGPIDARSSEGHTPLMVACREKRPHAAAELCAALRGTPALDEPDAAMERPLTLCARHGFEEGARALASAGARHDLPNRRGLLPLLLAAGRGHHAIVALLLETGADVRARTPGGATALSLARGEGHDESARLLERALAEREKLELSEAFPDLPPSARGSPRRL